MPRQRTADIARLPDSLAYTQRVWWAPWRTRRRYAALPPRQLAMLTTPLLHDVARWIEAEFQANYADPDLPDTPEVIARCAELLRLTWTVNNEAIRRQSAAAGRTVVPLGGGAWMRTGPKLGLTVIDPG